MSTCLQPPFSSAYRLVSDLQEPRSVGSVHRIRLDPPELEEALINKLGIRGWGRIHHFRNHYTAPWGEHDSAPLSPRAVESLGLFVRVASFPAGKTPSVFLTDRGGLELCWENERGESRQVEFTTDRIEYYLAGTEEEGAVGHEAVDELAQKLRS